MSVSVQREGFIFYHYLRHSWNNRFGMFSMATTKCTVLLGLLLLSYLQQVSCSLLVFVQLL